MTISLLDTLPQAMPLLLRLAVVTTIIPLLAALGALALRKASAAARYRVWLTGVLGCLVAIPTAAVLPSWVTWEPEPPSVEVAQGESAPVPPIAEPEQPTALPEASPEQETSQPVPRQPIEVDALPPIDPQPETGSIPAEEFAEPPPQKTLPVEDPQLAESPEEEPLPEVVAAKPTETATWHAWLTTDPHVPWAVGIWLLGAGLLLLRLALAVISAGRLVRGSRAVEDASESPEQAAVIAAHLRGTSASVRLSEQVSVPMLVGILRPTILLPTGAVTWNTDRLESALRHERAHILRRDIWWQLITSITASVLWFQPLLWLAARRLRIERELACDDLVLATGTPACDYAAHLLDFATQATSPTTSPLTVAMAQHTTVEKRIRSILNPNAKRTPLSRLAAGAITAVTLLVAIGTMALLPGGMGLTAGEEAEVIEEEEVETEEDVKPETKTIAGRVVDEEGNPVPGAGYFVMMLASQEELHKELQLTSEQRYVTGKANAKGEFQVSFPISADAARKLPLRLVAQTTDQCIGEADVLLNDAQVVEVMLRPGKIVKVAVVDPKEAPIEGAYVSATVRRPSGEHLRAFPGRLTDASGKAEILVPADAKVLQMFARRDGEGLYSSPFDPRSRRWPLNITDADLPEYPESGITLILDDEVKTVTTFTLSPGDEEEAENPPANENAAAEAENVAQPNTTTIAGQVVDEEGNPVPGATVTALLLQLDESWDRITLTADDQGRFRGTFGSRGRQIIPLTAMSETKFLLGHTTVRPDDDVTEISIKSRSANHGRVRVLDEAGEPIQGAHVGAVVMSSAQGAQRTNFGPRTDERGEAEILYFANDRVLQVYAFLDGKGLDYQTLSDRPILTWQATQEQWESLRAYPEAGVTLVLDGVLPVEVTVTSETGEPMAGVELTADFHPRKSGQMALATSFKPEWEIEGVTDRQGKWSLNSLPHWQRGTARFKARYKVTDSDLPVDYEHTYSIPGALAPRPEIGECRIVIPSLDYRVGHLLNPDGSPAVNRHVNWNTRRGRDNQAVTDEKGRFAYFQFDGSDEIYVRTADQMQAAIVPLDGTRPLLQEIKLRNTTTATGRLINRETDEPMPKQALIYGIQVQHEDPTYKFAFGLMTDEQGRFTITNLIPEATYNLGLHQMDDPSPDPIATITSQDDQPIDLGEIRVSADPAEEAENPPANGNAAAEAEDEAQPNKKTIAGQVVDEEGNPVAGIYVSFSAGKGPNVVTDEQGRFQMPRAPLPEEDEGRPWSIEALDDPFKYQLVGELRMPIKELRAQQNLDQFLNQLTVVVKRPSTAKVRVVDGEGNPVAGANVSGRVNVGVEVGTVITDEQGEALLRVPGKQPLNEVLAYKRGVGLDYRSFISLGPGKQYDPPSKKYPAEGVELVLDGVSPVEVLVQDKQGRPVEGASVYSRFTVARAREGDGQRMPVANSPIEDRQLVTDAQGRANFDWIPAWADTKGSTTFQVTSEKYLPTSGRYYLDIELYNNIVAHSPAMRELDQRLGNEPASGKLVIEVEELVSVPGMVRDEAGNPVAGIRVTAGGGGYLSTPDIHATTDGDGNYELKVAANRAYVITVTDDERVSDFQGPIAIFPDKSVDAVHLTLRPRATKVHGRLTDANGMPVVNRQINLGQVYYDMARLAELKLPNPLNRPRPIRPGIRRMERTDGEGRFEFLVGPGNYAVTHEGSQTTPAPPPVEFQISDEEERQVNLTIENPEVRRRSLPQ